MKSNRKKYPAHIKLLLLSVLCFSSVKAQNETFIQAIVKDSLSGEPVSFSSVQLYGTNIGTATDIDGYFSLRNVPEATELLVSSVGYKTKSVAIPQESLKKTFVILLCPDNIGLDEVVVKPEKTKYSVKNNPAVKLIEKVIRHKNENRMKNMPLLRYELYEKLTLYWDNFQLENRFLKKKFGFIENHLDTSVFTGKQVLPLSLRETLTDVRTDSAGNLHKHIAAKRSLGVESTFNDGSMDVFLEQVFQEIDIYDDDIDILLNRFVSATSSTLATRYYKFYIQDTIYINNTRCVNLAFFPFNPESYSFNGNLLVAIDDNYAVKRADLSIPKNLNINFLENLRVVLYFNKDENGNWINEKEDVYANFAMNDFMTKVYAHQTRSYRYNQTSGFGENRSVEKEDSFWENRRHPALKETEAGLPKLVSELQTVPIYRGFEKFLETVITGYIKTANERISKSKIDIGPVYTVYGVNPIEGTRFRLGGMTTAHLHPRWFLSGYTAYGTKDRRWKYSAHLAYSFVEKENYLQEFPRNDLSFSIEYDLYSLGMQINEALKDNLFVALGTAGISNRSYQNRYRLTYSVDWNSGVGFSAWWKHAKDTPAGALQYQLQTSENQFENIPSFSVSKIGIGLSYSPGMDKYAANRSGKDSKINFINDNIRLSLTHEYAYKGLSAGNYRFHQTRVSVSDRFWLSSFGHIDAQFSAGKVWNKTTFPMLASPQVNPSIFIEKERFQMIHPFEFIVDEFAALHTSYFLKGWLFNRLPLLKKLQLREVVAFSCYYGNLTAKNNPEFSDKLFLFPASSHSMKKEIYMEGSIGIENIFKVFRIDYLRRFTHLNHPNAKKYGIKIGFRFAF